MTESTSPRTHHLLVVDDDSGRRVFRLEATTYSIGRDPTCSILLHSPLVSRQHALLARIGGGEGAAGVGYRIFDGNSQGKPSKNGILVQGERRSAHDLEDGDLIEFAPEIRACYYIRTMSEDDISRYTQSTPFRSIKAMPIDQIGTSVLR